MDLQSIEEFLELVESAGSLAGKLGELKAATEKHNEALKKLNLAQDVLAMQAQVKKDREELDRQRSKIIADAKAEADRLAETALDRDLQTKEDQANVRNLRRQVEEQAAELDTREQEIERKEEELSRQRASLVSRESEIAAAMEDINGKRAKAEELIGQLS